MKDNHGKTLDEAETEEVETIEEQPESIVIDLKKIKPGVKLSKIKCAKWKESDHYAILGLQECILYYPVL